MIRLPNELYKRKEGAAWEGIVPLELREKDPIPWDPEEGLVTYYKGWKYPRPQVVDLAALKASDNIKKYLKSWLSILSFHPIKKWFSLFADFAESETEEFVLIDKCRPRFTREILRVCDVLRVDRRISDAIGVVLEQDLSYRIPLQDILLCLDKSAVQRNPAKEVKRLMGILDSRWKHGDRGWKKIGWALWFLIKIVPSFRKFLRDFAREIDLDKVRLNTIDLYNCLLIQGYDCQGMSYEARKTLHATL